MIIFPYTKYIIVLHYPEFPLHFLCFPVLHAISLIAGAKNIRGREETSHNFAALYLINGITQKRDKSELLAI